MGGAEKRDEGTELKGPGLIRVWSRSDERRLSRIEKQLCMSSNEETSITVFGREVSNAVRSVIPHPMPDRL